MKRLTHRALVVAAATSLALALGGCHGAAQQAAMPSDGEMTKMANDTVAAWTSMDAAKIKAIYAPNVVAFDFVAAPLETDRPTFDKAQDAFAAAKLNNAEQVSRTLQPLDPDTFVMSGAWNISSSSVPANKAAVRCTDVFHKDAAGAWPIVNEHCSAVPQAAAA